MLGLVYVFFQKGDGEEDNFFYSTKDILRASSFVFSGILEIEVAAGDFLGPQLNE